MPFIYKIINKVNNKCYIGKTLQDIQTRWKSHISSRNRKYYKDRPLYRAFNKYGIDSFEIVQVEECDYSIVDEREKYWISKFNTFGRGGYNATKGGDGRPYIDDKLVLDLWNQGNTIKEIQKITGYCVDSLKSVLVLNGIAREEISKRSRYAYICKPVLMLDKDTGEIIKEFASTEDANKFVKIKGRGHISEVCNGKRKTCYGYKWKWKY